MKDVTSHMSSEQKERRNILTVLLAGSLAAFTGLILYPVWRYLIPPVGAEPKPTNVAAGTIDELKPNTGKIFRFGHEPGILIKTREGELKAFNAVCTHLACTVQYREDIEHIWCACHNGHYDINGINIKGPPPRPLTPYKVSMRGDQVFASRQT